MLNTLSDGIDALLASPGDALLHAQVLDRLQERGLEGEELRRAVLELVIAHRESDGPRHVHARWCDLHGQPERAEFIRVQLELERMPAYRNIRLDLDWEDERYSTECRKAVGLRRREQSLWDGRLAWLDRSGWPWATSCESIEPGVLDYWTNPHLNPHRFFRRGFVAAVACATDYWLKHGDEICAEHPVERVRLTSLPPVEAMIGGPFDDRAVFNIRGRFKSITLSRESLLLNRAEHERTIAPRLLEAEWPGIEFDLPPPVATETLFPAYHFPGAFGAVVG